MTTDRPARATRRVPFGRDAGSGRTIPRRWCLEAAGYAVLGGVAGGVLLGASPSSVAIIPVVLGSVDSLASPLQCFPAAGVAVSRVEGGLALIALRCTHLGCVLRPAGRELVCPCHGGRFDLHGRVLSGPPREDLPWLQGGIDSARRLFVFPNLPQPVRSVLTV